MGIGNGGFVFMGTRLGGPQLLPSHYPSWGLGTCRVECLITPHGDWEHRAGVEPRTSSSSLPLMGIGNTWPRPGREIQPSSLPLMGIGNTVTVTSLGYDLRLITPHGDWEPRFNLEAIGGQRSPHYPSWGLGTTGGQSWRSNLTHYPSWGLGTRSIGRSSTQSLN